jgi:hypothetical protein
MASKLPKNLVGGSFTTERGLKFKILNGEHFPQNKISHQHRKYLSGLRAGQLVSVFFYGQPTPLITVGDGVVRLIEIEMGQETYKGSLEISKLLCVGKTRCPKHLVAH